MLLQQSFFVLITLLVRQSGLLTRRQNATKGITMKQLSIYLFGLIALIGTGYSQSSSASEPREIDISANDTMKYDTTAITAAPGESLRVIFTNAGTIPKDVMGHNWVLLNSGVDASAFASSASAFKDTGYIPTGRSGDIIAKINLLGPRKSGEVVFNAPTKPGVYTFLCTFPAHYLAGMHGTLTVK